MSNFDLVLELLFYFLEPLFFAVIEGARYQSFELAFFPLYPFPGFGCFPGVCIFYFYEAL